MIRNTRPIRGEITLPVLIWIALATALALAFIPPQPSDGCPTIPAEPSASTINHLPPSVEGCQ